MAFAWLNTWNCSNIAIVQFILQISSLPHIYWVLLQLFLLNALANLLLRHTWEKIWCYLVFSLSLLFFNQTNILCVFIHSHGRSIVIAEGIHKMLVWNHKGKRRILVLLLNAELLFLKGWTSLVKSKWKVNTVKPVQDMYWVSWSKSIFLQKKNYSGHHILWKLIGIYVTTQLTAFSFEY